MVAAEHWALLGLRPDADVAAIRRAYARKLKVTRPDDDPVAFQALVAARDYALHHAERRRAWETEADESEYDANDLADGVDPGRPEWLPLQAHWPSPEVHIELVSPEAQADPLPLFQGELAPSQLRPAWFSPVIHVELPLLEARTEPSQSSTGRYQGSRLHLEHSPDRAAAADAMLARLADADAGDPDITAWHDLLRALGDLSDAERRAREPVVVRLLGHLLATACARTRPAGWREPLSLFRGEAVPDPDAFLRDTALADLMAAFDEEFGWRRADRSVHAALPGRGEADAFMWRLGSLLATREGEGARRLDEHGVPVIPPSDATLLFGADDKRYLALIKRASQSGRWPIAWRWNCFLFAPFWALVYRVPVYAGIWLAAVMLCVYLHSLLASAGLRGGGADLLTVAPLIAVHLWCGAFGYRAIIRSGHRALLQADRRFFPDQAERSAFLVGSMRKPRRISGRQALGRLLFWALLFLLWSFARGKLLGTWR